LKKRSIIGLLILLSAIAITSILLSANKGGDISKVKLESSESQLYTQEDIKAVMDIVLDYFKREFKGCSLRELWYDEGVSNRDSVGWAEQYEADEAIVLLSNFDVDASGGDGSLNPNTSYRDWQWILVRNKGGKWELKTWGY
jgi:hypothetical protein